MMENSKTCKMCYSEIDARAKKCPHCQHWQNRLFSVLFQPAVVVLIIFLILMKLFARSPFDTGRDFKTYKDQVLISRSTLTFGQNNCGPTLVVMGTFKNETDITWKDLHIEVTYFDRSGALIDTGQDYDYSFLVSAKAETPFKISMKREFPADKYSTYNVRILAAKDAKSFF
jgi:hypothetical protein